MSVGASMCISGTAAGVELQTAQWWGKSMCTSWQVPISGLSEQYVSLWKHNIQCSSHLLESGDQTVSAGWWAGHAWHGCIRTGCKLSWYACRQTLSTYRGVVHGCVFECHGMVKCIVCKLALYLHRNEVVCHQGDFQACKQGCVQAQQWCISVTHISMIVRLLSRERHHQLSKAAAYSSRIWGKRVWLVLHVKHLHVDWVTAIKIHGTFTLLLLGERHVQIGCHYVHHGWDRNALQCCIF
jgi:hypothetical protein